MIHILSHNERSALAIHTKVSPGKNARRPSGRRVDDTKCVFIHARAPQRVCRVYSKSIRKAAVLTGSRSTLDIVFIFATIMLWFPINVCARARGLCLCLCVACDKWSPRISKTYFRLHALSHTCKCELKFSCILLNKFGKDSHEIGRVHLLSFNVSANRAYQISSHHHHHFPWVMKTSAEQCRPQAHHASLCVHGSCVQLPHARAFPSFTVSYAQD